MSNQPESSSSKPKGRLVVDEADNDNNSFVTMHPMTMANLQLFRGATLLIKVLQGKKRKDAVCICQADKTCNESNIKMNKIIRINLKVRLGDVVSVHYCRDVQFGKHINILPLNNTMEGATRDLFHDCLKSYFSDVSRPVRKGDHFLVKRGTTNVKFEVTETNPAVYCALVDSYTEIICDGEPVKRDDVPNDGGLSNQIAHMRELSVFPTRHPQLSKDILALKLYGLQLLRNRLFKCIETGTRIRRFANGETQTATTVTGEIPDTFFCPYVPVIMTPIPYNIHHVKESKEVAEG